MCFLQNYGMFMGKDTFGELKSGWKLTEKAAKEVLGELEVIKIPIADGGEGTVAAVVEAAAGGLGYGLMAVFGADLKPGITEVLDLANFSAAAKDADLIITGEGAIDFQSAYGKVLWGIGKQAKKLHVPVVAIAGTVGVSPEELEQLGITAAFSITNGPMELEHAIKNAAQLCYNTLVMVFRLVNI